MSIDYEQLGSYLNPTKYVNPKSTISISTPILIATSHIPVYKYFRFSPLKIGR